MDWTALTLSLELAAWTVAILLPVSVLAGRWLAYGRFRSKGAVEALVMLPLVLPPTVFGFYLLLAFGRNSPIGAFWQQTFGHQLVFTFEGLVVASVIFNLPFAIQPAQRGFEAIAVELREAAATCGMSPWRSLLKVELPLAWPGLMTAMVLTFAHTLGEFGIVLMVGGSIPGETKTIAIAIYDRVQGFDMAAAGTMSAVLVAISFSTIAVTYWLSARIGRRLA
ncbi:MULTISPECIES: molybdate ABC transporter permease subunit [unclassified Paracoccus (in: a-proteobacteria)]|uniref:molybdate ABC transporter permease subunit n=1 Tax=unclassified Paracoccus (in: a-proteobacteria) TaxID=2688777 RepID=UPI0012B28051|nr:MULTISPECIES: molybdate ABC transporter permease subunit [unclassified Paracoccus (in: a-proteobacteria)]UXU74311.1 molybdate ABC transporter permease subunit [Paracoccus sp. SMMA_5]UXU80201.1 molybdate ABC transporter permease subunit [Paracoccus sp. SMMA_5_TC]